MQNNNNTTYNPGQWTPSKKNIDEAAEKALLSYLLRNTDKVMNYGIIPRDFSDPRNAFIFQAICKCKQVGRASTPAAVMHLANKVNFSLEESYIDGLYSFIDPTPAPEKNVDSISGRRKLREIAITARSIQEAAEKGIPPSKLRVMISDAFNKAFTGGEESTMADNFSSITESILERAKNFSPTVWRSNGIYTGIDALDTLFDGLRGGVYALFGAAPGVGKTAASLQIVDTNISEGKPGLIFSLDMDKEILVCRLAARKLGINFKTIVKGDATPYQLQKLEKELPAFTELVNKNMVVQGARNITVSDIKGDLYSYKAKHGQFPSFVIVDYLTCLAAEPTYKGEQVGKYLQITKDLRSLINEVQIPFFVFSQLNAAGLKDRPGESSYAGSVQIFQDADVACVMSRTAKAELREDKCAVILFDVHKSRVSATSEIMARFDGAYQKFLPAQVPADDLPERMDKEAFHALPPGNFRRAA